MSKNKHVLQVVGRSGMKKAYLDVSKEEALRQFHQDKSTSQSLPLEAVKSIHFDHEFKVTNAWPSDHDVNDRLILEEDEEE